MTTLTDRYVYATSRSVPSGRRDEIAAELRASIADMVEARTADGASADDAEREVLTGLGDPRSLAAQYADRPRQLIGPAYYDTWLGLMTLLVPLVPAVVATIVAVVGVVDDAPFGTIVGDVVGALIGTAVQVAFWTTLTFAVLDRLVPEPPIGEWDVSSLPEVPGHREITLADTGPSIAFLVLAVAFLPWQHFRSWVEDAGGDRVPLLDPDLWASWLPVVVVLLLMEIGLEVAKYRAGRWTVGHAVVNAVLAIGFAAVVVPLLLGERLLNPELVQRYTWLGDHLDTVMTASAVGVVLVGLWEIGDAFWRATRRTGSSAA